MTDLFPNLGLFKEYYEIVDEARPLSGFFPTHAEFFTEMHTMKLSKPPKFQSDPSSNCFTIDVWNINCWLHIAPSILNFYLERCFFFTTNIRMMRVITITYRPCEKAREINRMQRKRREEKESPKEKKPNQTRALLYFLTRLNRLVSFK